MQEYKNWIFTLDKFDVFKLVDFTFSAQGLVKGDRVLNKMKEFIPDINIEDLKIYYAATATDISRKEEIVFTKGSLYKAEELVEIGRLAATESLKEYKNKLN